VSAASARGEPWLDWQANLTALSRQAMAHVKRDILSKTVGYEIGTELNGEGGDDTPYCTLDNETLAWMSPEPALTCKMAGGLERCWWTWVPTSVAEGATPEGPVPLVVDMHGLGACASTQAWYSGWRQIAEREGFVVVWPQGTYDLHSFWGEMWDGVPGWNGGWCCGAPAEYMDDVPDTQFIRQVIAETVRTDYIDERRIYAAGHSTGCIMAQRLALDAPELIAAVGCHSGQEMLFPLHAYHSTPGYRARPVPIYEVHGVHDGIVRYDQTAFWPGSEENMVTWANRSRCEPEPVVTASVNPDSGERFVTHTYEGCKDGIRHALLALPDITNWWAAHCPFITLGYTTIDTTQLAWDFIKEFSQP